MKDQVWFITGASKGLGLVLARRVLEEGGRVAATSRSKRALTEALGERALALEVDLLDERSVEAAVRATLERFGRIDVVVNNAGYGQLGAIEEVTAEEVRKNYEVNVFGLLNVLRATVPSLRRQRSGHVFNVASIGGFVGGFPGWGIYCSTKFAVAGITEGLAADLAEHGVKVTLVYPGYFRTEFLSSGSVAKPSAPIAEYGSARTSEREHVEHIHGNQPGDPEKLARCLIAAADQEKPPFHLFLGSDALAMAERKVEELRAEVDRNRAVSVSTDFNAPSVQR